MDTFGGRLKHEREDRGLSIPAVAETLRVDQELLLALERDDFEALPDEAALTNCLRGYADLLEVEVDLMIEDWAQERDAWEQGAGSVTAERVAVPSAPPTVAAAGASPKKVSWLVALIVLAVVVLVALWALSGDEAEPGPAESPTAAASVEPPPSVSETPGDAGSTSAETTPVPVEATTAPAAEAPEPSAATADPPASEAPPPPRAAPETATLEAASPSSLSVTEHGVGSGVEDRRLVGRSDRFEEGTRVWFWTRVQGGIRGDRVVHVWLMEGVEQARVSLEIGGPSWRTSSTKTLDQGVGSEWVVEARDQAGRVLARSEFLSTP